MLSHIAEDRRLSFTHSRHDGGRYRYLCEFARPRQNDYGTMSWAIELSNADALLEGSPWAIGISNTSVGPTDDPSGALSAEEEALLARSGGDEASFMLLGQADLGTAFQSIEGATITATQDIRGHDRAVEVVASPSGGCCGAASPG